MMMLTDPNGGVHAPHTIATNSNSNMGISVTPTAASANANANRRPRAQSMQQFSEKTSLGSASPRDCSSSGSFVSKLFRMVDSEPSSIVSWTRGGTAFCIVDPKMMAEHCLPKYFRHRRFSSLIRQLNFYSFYRVQEGQLAIYQHSFFRKGRPDLLVHIKRRGAGKAKDPLFDPLSSPGSSSNSSSAPSVAEANASTSSNTNSHTNSSHTSSNSKHSNVTMTSASGGHPSLNLGVIGVNTMSASSGMICYSPMSKPVMMENMSPALKPGMAPTAPPPMVDMGGSLLAAPSEEQLLASKSQQQSQQRWEFSQRESEQGYPLSAALQLKSKHLYMESLHQSPMMRPSECNVGALPAPLDLDIQDFLTEDCSINAGGMGELKSEFDDRLCGSSMSASVAPLHAKHAMVSRDLLKWDGKCEAELPSSSSSHVAGLLASHDDESSGAFEDELLLDLANVEPDAWEVPLSPLNEEEDMMPWLDLCF